MLCHSKQRFYTKDNKQDTPLAWKIHNFDPMHKPYRLKLDKRTTTSKSLKIVTEFAYRLSTLYSTPSTTSQEVINKFLYTVNLPTLPRNYLSSR